MDVRCGAMGVGKGVEMLEIKIDIVPFGFESERKNLDTLKVVNTGHSANPEYGEYQVHHPNGSFDLIAKHKRSEGFWSLVRKVIKEYLND